jgi:tetratricopeptide (TPR) repeat protein
VVEKRRVMEPQRSEGSAQTLWSQGLALHQAGRLGEARQQYEAALAIDPRHFDSLHLLGVICIQTGGLDQGAALIGQAIALNPHVAAAHGNLANAFNGLGRYEDALASCDRALALQPDHAESHGNRGLALYQLGRPGEALGSFDRLIALKPTHAKAHCNRGIMLRDLARLEEALASFGQAIALKPDYAEACYSQGITLNELGRPLEALDSFDRAIALRPDYAEAWYNQGIALRELRRPLEALASYDRAIALKPDYAEAHSNRGNALTDLKRYEEALASYDRAIALKPDYAEAYGNRGVMLFEMRRMEEALADYDRAIALKPDYAEAHYNRAMHSLTQGDYARGWAQYEWRWRTTQFEEAVRDLAAPLWLGREDLRGRTILLHAEQGLGDTLQFCRYVPQVAARGATVVLEVQAGLERLLARLEGVDRIVTRGQALPPHDFHTPLVSLPLALGAGPDGDLRPYLEPDPEQAAAWAARLAGTGGLRVGLCWAGGSRPDQPIAHAIDKRRSLPLEAFAPLAAIPGLELYSLQKGPPAAQLLEVQARGWPGPPIIDLTAELKDFADTAALVANLDLVISCDTSTAHLAGGLCVPVWILNRFDACWRWLADRDDSPWYPGARLFRQTVPGAWDDVIEQVKRDLLALAAQGRPFDGPSE